MVMRYIEGSGSLPGIPTRDLTDEEVMQFGRIFLLKSGLYQEDKPPIKKNVITEEKEK